MDRRLFLLFLAALSLNSCYTASDTDNVFTKISDSVIDAPRRYLKRNTDEPTIHGDTKEANDEERAFFSKLKKLSVKKPNLSKPKFLLQKKPTLKQEEMLVEKCPDLNSFKHLQGKDPTEITKKDAAKMKGFVARSFDPGLAEAALLMFMGGAFLLVTLGSLGYASYLLISEFVH